MYIYKNIYVTHIYMQLYGYFLDPLTGCHPQLKTQHKTIKYQSAIKKNEIMQLVVPKAGEVGEGWMQTLGLADANYHIQNG